MTATRRSSRMATEDNTTVPPSQSSDACQEGSEDERREPQETLQRRSPRVKKAVVTIKGEGSVVEDSVGSAPVASKRKRDGDGSQENGDGSEENGSNQKTLLANESELKKEGVRKSPRARNVLSAASYNSSDLSASDIDTKPPSKKTDANNSKKLKNFNNQRVLQQVAPMDDMEKMISEVEKEYAHLLVCDEPLEPSKDPLVTADQALFNRRWERLFRELLVFKNVYGHTIVPKMHMENRSLAVFVGNQRKFKKKRDRGEESPMTDSRLKRLEAVGFVWDAKKHKDFWNIQANCDQAMELWEENFQMLVRYKDQIGDCLVPKVFPANQQLARWVGRQRQHYRFLREGKYSSLTEEKVKRLEDIGFIFDTRNRAMRRRNLYMRYAGRWDEYYNRLLEYRETHGHSCVPRRWKADQSLASWVQRQRHEYKLKRAGKYNHLTEYRMKKLEAVDFEFVKGPQKEIRDGEEDEIQDDFDVDEEALKKRRILQGIRYESDSVSDGSRRNGKLRRKRKAHEGLSVAGSEDEDENEDNEEDDDDVDEAEEEHDEDNEEDQDDEDDEEEREDEEEDEDDDEDDEKEVKSESKKGKITARESRRSSGKAKSSGNEFKAKRVLPRLSSRRIAQVSTTKVRQRPLPIRHRLIRGRANAENTTKSDEATDQETDGETSKAKAEPPEPDASDRVDLIEEPTTGEKHSDFEGEVQTNEEVKSDSAEATCDENEAMNDVAEAETCFVAEGKRDGEQENQDADENGSNEAAALHKQEDVEEEIEEMEILQEDIGPGISGRPSRQGAWKCSYCSEDDFTSFVDASVHESICGQFKTTGTLTI